MNKQRRQHVITAVAAAGGLALFTYSVRNVGTDEILSGIHRVGWGLLPILALAGLRFVFRAEAWRLCTPVNSRLTLRQALVAFLAGDALGNVTPLGLIASEPAKVFLTRHHLATSESVASLAIDNLVYALSVVTMIAAGVIVMLLTVPLPFEVQEWSFVLLVALVIIGAGSLLDLPSASGTVTGLGAVARGQAVAVAAGGERFFGGQPEPAVARLRIRRPLPRGRRVRGVPHAELAARRPEPDVCRSGHVRIAESRRDGGVQVRAAQSRRRRSDLGSVCAGARREPGRRSGAGGGAESPQPLLDGAGPALYRVLTRSALASEDSAGKRPRTSDLSSAARAEFPNAVYSLMAAA